MERSDFDFETVVVQAELLVSSPDSVAAYLKMRGERLVLDPDARQVGDEEMESALRAVGHPRINLALARYGAYQNTVRTIFQEATAGSGVRLAALINRALGSYRFAWFPSNLFAAPTDFHLWLQAAPMLEINAAFSNPAFSKDLLVSILNDPVRYGYVRQSERLWRTICALESNDLVRNRNNKVDADSVNVSSSVWRLAETAPTDARWGEILGTIFSRLQFPRKLDNPLNTAKRWFPTEGNQDDIACEEHALMYRYYGKYEWPRAELAKVAFHQRDVTVDELLASEDRALRSAAYAMGDLKEFQMKVAFEKDGEFALCRLGENLGLWQTAESRSRIKHAVDSATFPISDEFNERELFDEITAHFRRIHPSWF